MNLEKIKRELANIESEIAVDLKELERFKNLLQSDFGIDSTDGLPEKREELENYIRRLEEKSDAIERVIEKKMKQLGDYD